MDIILAPKGGGKTTALIRISAATGYYIVCSHTEVHRVADKARKMGLSIPLPIGYDEFLGRDYYGKGIRGFLIDNVEMLLRMLTATPIYAATITGRIVTNG